MKKSVKILGLVGILLLGALSLMAGVYHPVIEGVQYGVSAAVVLPTQQIVFIRSLQEEYVKIDTWLNEAQDLSSFVVEGQTLRFPEAGASPAVYKNRTTDVDSVEPAETTYDVSLDYYDSQNYKMRNINMHALPFDKMAYYTKKSADAIKVKEIADAAYAYAPTNAGGKRIIIPTTGASRNGLKMLILDDIISLARILDNYGFPELGRNLVLPSDMWWDLVNNNAILKGQLERSNLDGNIKPLIVEYYSFKIHRAFGNSLGVAYNIGTSTKAAQGAIITGNVVPAGFVFISSEVFRAGGAFEMFLTPKAQNSTGRADEFGFAHRFKADFTKDTQKYSAMIYQAIGDIVTESISILPSTLEFEAGGESKVAAVNSTSAFTAAVVGEGFTIETVGNAITVTAAANAGVERVGTVTVTNNADNTKTDTIELTQAAGV